MLRISGQFWGLKHAVLFGTNMLQTCVSQLRDRSGDQHEVHLIVCREDAKRRTVQLAMKDTWESFIRSDILVVYEWVWVVWRPY